MTDTPLEHLIQQVKAAEQSGQPLAIRGGNTKAFYGRPVQGEALDVSAYSGISQYDPTELVITAKAGTSLREIEALLAENQQMLAFEPPHFSGQAPAQQSAVKDTTKDTIKKTLQGTITKTLKGTIGGAFAAGLAGPRRPWSGDVRDFALGISLLNGRGQVLQFGGQVMKNVAGYDISRLMAGSLGCLGVLLDVSLKVLPIPQAQRYLRIECTYSEATAMLLGWQMKTQPISGACFDGTYLHLRLEGALAGIEAFENKLDLAFSEDKPLFWQDLRDHQLAFFKNPAPFKNPDQPENSKLWRLSLPQGARFAQFPDRALMDWGGCQYWIHSSDAEAIRALAKEANGYATCFRENDNGCITPFPPLAPGLLALHKNLKKAYDPAGIFNRGRMYADL